MSRGDKFSWIVLGGTTVLCLLLLARALLTSPAALPSYGVPLVGLVFLGLTFRLHQAARVNAALVVVALGISFYAAEAALYITERGHYQRHFDFEVQRMRGARLAGVPYDRRSRLDVVTDLNEQGVPAVARVHPASWVDSDGLGSGTDRLFPLSGISRSLEVTCNESGTWVLVESDEHGFRNPLGQYDTGIVDVAVIGDSYAYGSCVAQGEETAALLRRSGKRVLNLGYGGNGPLIELATLKEYAEPFTPRTVLWFYFEGNDLQDLVSESESALLTSYMDPGHHQGLLDRAGQLDQLRRDYHDQELWRARAAAEEGDRRRRRCVALLCALRKLPPGPPAERTPPLHPIGLLGAVLEEARNRVGGWGGKFFVVYLPAWGRYQEDSNNGPDRRPEVLTMLHDAGIEVIDFSQVVGAHPDPLNLFPFRSRAHYTSEGYALLADLIKRRLAGDSGSAH